MIALSDCDMFVLNTEDFDKSLMVIISINNQLNNQKCIRRNEIDRKIFLMTRVKPFTDNKRKI